MKTLSLSMLISALGVLAYHSVSILNSDEIARVSHIPDANYIYWDTKWYSGPTLVIMDPFNYQIKVYKRLKSVRTSPKPISKAP